MASRHPDVRPLIGLTGRTKLAAAIQGFPASLAGAEVDMYVRDYARAITAAGGLPVHLPGHIDPSEYAQRLDGVLLSGGADVAPERYGAAAETDVYPPEPERDRFELALVDAALGEDLPVLGICRGLQLLNVWGGGTLHQHVPEHARYDIAPHEPVDEIRIDPESRLHELYGARRAVNSLHHQTVDRVATGWVVTARSADGTVEALEWPGHDILAVQWHPEMMETSAVDPLFRWLVERATERRDAGCGGAAVTTGEVVGAALVAHVPTIVLPEEVRRELNDGQEISLVPGLHRMKAERLDRLRPDTIVVFDAHWYTTVEFVVAAHDQRAGLYTSEELPRGMAQMPYDFRGDPELARLMAKEVTAAGSWMTAIDDPHLPIHYPTTNLLPFLQGDERWVSVSVAQTGETDDFLLVGAAVGRAIARSGRRVVLLASGAMSHTFWKLKELRAHEASDPSHIRTPEARQADLERLAWFAAGDHARVLDTMPEFLRQRPEGMFAHYLMMVAAIGGRDCRAPGIAYSDYENSIGTGQAHVWFERPAGGWMSKHATGAAPAPAPA